MRQTMNSREAIGGRFRLHSDVPFLHANLGNTEDWPMKFTATEEHTPGLCRLLNELQDEMERPDTG